MSPARCALLSHAVVDAVVDEMLYYCLGGQARAWRDWQLGSLHLAGCKAASSQGRWNVFWYTCGVNLTAGGGGDVPHPDGAHPAQPDRHAQPLLLVALQQEDRAQVRHVLPAAGRPEAACCLLWARRRLGLGVQHLYRQPVLALVQLCTKQGTPTAVLLVLRF